MTAPFDSLPAPFRVRCDRCGAAAGSPCRNYRGQRKPMCKTRGIARVRPEAVAAPDLFAGRGLFDQPETE